MQYLHDILRYRYFWTHLALSDLRMRFRRSYLGLLWAVLQPLLLTVIISIAMKMVFQQSFIDYSVYLFSGMIVWDFVTGCVNSGATCFLGAEGYIRQTRLPMAIYPLKTVLYCFIIFILALAGFTAYTALFKPQVFSWQWIYLLPFFGVLIAFAAPLAIISAIINIRFRDYQQFIGLALQILWYLSPILLPRELFDRPELRDWAAINPIVPLMDVFRGPLLNGTVPLLSQYSMLLVWAAGLWVVAISMLVKHERKIIFYY